MPSDSDRDPHFYSRVALGAAVLALICTSCGGGLPLLHPAQVLPSGVTSFSAGMGSNWVGGEANREVEKARAATASGLPPTALSAAPAVAASLWSPGLFPWVSMRLGLGRESETGATYTGHRARVDARHALLFGHWALSLGLGAGLGLAHPSSGESGTTSTFGVAEPVSGLDTSRTRSFAFDAPVILGWHSAGDIARVWFGLRPSYEHAYGTLTFASASATSEADFSANAMTLGGLFGLAMGLRPLFVAMELSVGESRARGSVSGSPGAAAGGSASVSAISLTPAAALIWEIR
jgi:hypothetical protein